ncbi:MAG TPA: ABC transporter substrate-binding protein [Pseudolabrys sp.]|nr:ABC transporter substrate-binding protein [Pseudolabrys sp.]
MRRRQFIKLLGGATVAWPLAARAQRAGGLPTIAVLGSGAADSDSSKTQIELLDAGMHEAGLELGRDYVFETRWANSDSSRFPALATELLALHPAAVVVSTNLAVTTVQNLSRSVPIVDPSLNAPVATGLVTSLSHPGGNVTGVSTMADELIFKSIELMREVLPHVHNVTVMLNPTNPSNPVMLDMVTRQFASKEPIIDSVGVRSPADIDVAFAEVARQKPDALLVLTDNSLQGLAETIVARATAQRVPVFGSFTLAFARAGALVNYARDQKEAHYGAARILKKILAGVSPADIPIEQPTKFNLVINLQAAKALGIVIPGTVLARASDVIE